MALCKPWQPLFDVGVPVQGYSGDKTLDERTDAW